MSATIRPASPSDTAAVAMLHAGSWQRAYRGLMADAYLDNVVAGERAKLWEDRFLDPRPNQYVALAESDGEPAGFVALFGADDAHWGTLLDNLHVAEHAQRGGIGASLMRHAAQWCLGHYPASTLYLWVLTGNKKARRFYEKVGCEYADEGVWHPPDGSALPKIRCVWKDLEKLAAHSG